MYVYNANGTRESTMIQRGVPPLFKPYKKGIDLLRRIQQNESAIVLDTRCTMLYIKYRPDKFEGSKMVLTLGNNRDYLGNHPDLRIDLLKNPGSIKTLTDALHEKIEEATLTLLDKKPRRLKKESLLVQIHYWNQALRILNSWHSQGSGVEIIKILRFTNRRIFSWYAYLA